MEPIEISGASKLSAITDRIRDAEVTRRKFMGVVIDGGNNHVTFQTQNVPPKPTLVMDGEPPPPGTVLDWFGEMQVEGRRARVQLYRKGAVSIATAPMGIAAQISRTQEALGVTVDGKPGPETWLAIDHALNKALPPLAVAANFTDERSERAIATLLPDVQAYARALYYKCKDHGLTIKIISGTRSFAEQEVLWQKGRDKSGKVVDKSKVVTNARAGHSNHNYGIAFDVGVFRGRTYITDFAAYAPVGVLGQELGLEWGGSWTNLKDGPHFQLRPAWAAGMSERDMIAELRRQFPNGMGDGIA